MPHLHGPKPQGLLQLLCENRIAATKLITLWIEPRIDAVIKLACVIAMNMPIGIVQKISYALLNIGWLPIQNFCVVVDPVDFADPEYTAVDDLAIRPCILIKRVECLENMNTRSSAASSILLSQQ